MPLALSASMLRQRAAFLFFILVSASAVLYGQSSVLELNDAGWKALEDGNTRRAVSLFGEALTLRPNDPVLLTGSAAALAGEGRRGEAVARLKRAVQVKPDFTQASILLGRIAYDDGDTALAIKTYEDALKHAPGDAVITSMLEVWRHESNTHRSFEETRYDRFRVMFEGRAEQALATQAAAILESAFFRIGEKLGSYPSNTIVAVLYTEQQFRDITRAPEWSGGQYDGRIRIPVAGASRNPALFEEVLVHELTHAVLDAIAGPRVPAWLDEGLAQFFDGSNREQARRRLRAAGRTIPLRRLERSFGSMNAADAQIAYDESLLAVGVMLDRAGFGWHILLSRLAGGQTFAEAIPNFGFSYEDLEAGFR
jgi:tetratricopeptide (TPR) repeat protein